MAQGDAVLAEVESRVKVGDTVRVTDEKGRRTTARFEGLSENSLLLLREGTPLSMPTASIHLIERRRPDPVWNSILIGAAPGIILTAAEGGPCSTCGGPLLIVLGAGIGAIIDASKHRYDPVYLAPQKRVRFDASPLLFKDKKGVAFTVRF